jgi:hypothetical protein
VAEVVPSRWATQSGRIVLLQPRAAASTWGWLRPAALQRFALAEIRPREMDPSQVRVAKIRDGHVRLAEVRQGQACLSEHGPEQEHFA